MFNYLERTPYGVFFCSLVTFCRCFRKILERLHTKFVVFQEGDLYNQVTYYCSNLISRHIRVRFLNYDERTAGKEII